LVDFRKELKMMQLNDFIQIALENEARRFHVVSGTVPVMQTAKGIVRYEVDRVLPPQLYQIVDQFITPQDKKTLLESSEVLVQHNFNSLYSVRVHIYKQRGTLAISCKIMDNKIWSLQEVDFPEVLQEFFFKKMAGLVLIGGPSDSGRTTTLNAVVDNLAKTNSLHIVMMDSLIEGVFPSYDKSLISRRVYGREIPDMKSYCYSLLKEDFDVLTLGELDSVEKLETAIRLASRGILVIGTYLCVDSLNGLKNLINGYDFSSGVRSLIPECLVGMYHQSFFRDIGGNDHFVHEALTNNSVVQKHLRDNNFYALDNYMKSTSHKDCMPYKQSFEKLVANQKLDAEDIPMQYR
jgi:twitching motility protein PilT